MTRSSVAGINYMFILNTFVLMLLINTCVFDSCCQTMLFGWTILQIDNDRLTLTEFCERMNTFTPIGTDLYVDHIYCFPIT